MKPLRQAIGMVLLVLLITVPALGADLNPLLKQLKSDDVDVRRAAAKALGEMGEEARAAAPALIAAIKSDKDVFVRRFAAQALGEVGGDRKAAVAALRPVLREDKKELVEAAITSLGKLGPEAVPALIDALKLKDVAKPEKPMKKGPAPVDHASFLRARAATSLGQLGPDAKAAVPALMAALNDANIRTEAALALGKIGSGAKEAVPALRDAANSKATKKDKSFKSAAKEAIKQIGG